MDMKERLDAQMKMCGLDAAKLEALTGIKRTRINGIFNGEVKDVDAIGVGRMLAIAAALGVSVEWLYGKEEPRCADDEVAVVSAMRHMNDEGRELVANYAVLLDDSGKYKKDHELGMVEEA